MTDTKGPAQPPGAPDDESHPAHRADDGPHWPRAVGPEKERRSGGFLAALRELAIVVVAALVISALVRVFLVQAFWVPSGSMEDTLLRGDRILVWKPGGEPGRGDVVVFKDPADWLADPVPREGWQGALNHFGTFLGVLPSTTGDDLVKRVIAVGGDTIECCSPDGRIIRNGEPIDEPYIHPDEPTDQVVFRVEVPEGRLFVMGDHRADSADSRYHMEIEDGTVPVENVVGRAVVIIWPFERWATLPDFQPAAPA
ncbi:MAG: signal peptidase I [Candidatus Nanopelagicales bacterium]